MEKKEEIKKSPSRDRSPNPGCSNWFTPRVPSSATTISIKSHVNLQLEYVSIFGT